MRPIGKINEYAAAAMAVARPVIKTIATKIAVDKGTEYGKKGVDAVAAKLKKKPPAVTNDREVT